MNIQIKASAWGKRATRPEVTGYEFALRCEEIRDFYASLDLVSYDIYTTPNFGDYIGKMARAFKINEHPENFTIYDKYDLHEITCNSAALVDFDEFLERQNAGRIRQFYDSYNAE